MSEGDTSFGNDSAFYDVLKKITQVQSNESLDNSLIDDFNGVWSDFDTYGMKMLSTNPYQDSCNTSCDGGSYASTDTYNDSILEEDGRISLAYENLRTIPRKIADKFSIQTKFLDLGHNNFQNLAFLTSFEDLHTLILDRNPQINPYTFPYLPNLEILWLNNCNISNIAEWIQRIRKQCPSLNHLSIMENPGRKAVFSYCSIHRECLPHEAVPTTASNCREYILDMLPGLEILDGQPRKKSSEFVTNGKIQDSSTTTSANSISSHKKPNGHHTFRNLFQLKRRKKSNQSSSTN